jgi:hypothetical protein
MQPETLKAIVPIALVISGTVIAIAAAISPNLSDAGRATLAGAATGAISGAAGLTNLIKIPNESRDRTE